MNGRGAAVFGAVGLLLACGERGGDSDRPPARTAAARVIAQDVRLAPQWEVQLDSALPRANNFDRMAVGHDHVFAVDAERRAVLALRRADGHVAWALDAGAVGGVPDFVPRNVTVDVAGHPVVADAVTRRAVVLDPATGRTIRNLQTPGIVLGLCGLNDASLLLLVMATERPVVRVDTLGRVLERWDLPWTPLRGTMPDVYEAALVGGAGRSCVLATHHADGYGVWRDSTFVPRRYIEPTSRMQQTTGIAGTIVGDEVAVGFRGTSELRGRLLDYYEAASGAYRRTVIADLPVRWLAGDDSTLYLLLRTNRGRSLRAVQVAR